VRTLWSQGDSALAEFVANRPKLSRRGYGRELHELAAALPQRVLYLDLETCGFAGAPLFLVGLLRYDGAWQVEQLLARDYTEEPAVLNYLGALIPRHDVLVTFNGKSFDWPFLHDRGTVHRVRLARPATHCDMLRHARARWKRALGLPDCRLQTLESHLCRRYRSGDIAGREIPAAYHSFVRTGDGRQLDQIVQHNALDLVTLAQLSLVLLREAERSGPVHHHRTLPGLQFDDAPPIDSPPGHDAPRNETPPCHAANPRTAC
jgi:hypothetical protein